jgi:hypothetical protein
MTRHTLTLEHGIYTVHCGATLLRRSMGNFPCLFGWYPVRRVWYKKPHVRGVRKWKIFFEEKAQKLWLSYFISIHFHHVRRHTILLVRRLMAPAGIIAVCRLNLDVIEASSGVYTETLMVLVMKKRYSYLT